MNSKWRARSKKDLVIEVWEQLDCESVGATELQLIQKAINDAFGAGAVESPASIARLLADEGAILRHPEVLNFDSAWRQRFELATYREMSFASLIEATTSIQQLDTLRREYEQKEDDLELRRLGEFVNEVLDDLRLLARSETTTKRGRAEAREIADWISIWQGTPDLFAAWLELRLISGEFLKLFPDFRFSNNKSD